MRPGRRWTVRPLCALLASVSLVAGCDAAGPREVAAPETPTASPVAQRPTPTAPREARRPKPRPNLLVIEADDMRLDDLRFMPRTRRLVARRGLEFRNAFANNPLCCPSRASLLTGRHSHNHRVLSHEPPYGFSVFDDSVTLATVLQGAGYRTALVGKYLNGYGVGPTRAGDPDSAHYVPPGWTQWYGSVDEVAGSPGAGTYDYFHLVSNVNGTLTGWPGRYSTAVTAGQVRRLVADFADVAADGGRRPWFVWWTPVAPHHGDPVEPDDPGAVRRADGFLSTYLTPARPAWAKDRYDARITHGAGTPRTGPAERDVSDKPAYLRSLPELTAQERRTVAEVTRQRAEALLVLDVEVARTLRALRVLGEAEDTVVVVTSDNGFYLGEHRKRQGKANLHEPSVRVPLLVRGPGVPRGVRFDPATIVDLGVTLARLGGGRLPRADGVDLWPVIAGGDRGWLRPVLLEGRMPERSYAAAGEASPTMRGLNTVAVRTGRWKLVVYATGEAELYDLRRDPLELESRHGLGTRTHRELRRLVRDLRDCSGASCTVRLPPRLRLDPGENRWLTVRQQRAVDARFG